MDHSQILGNFGPKYAMKWMGKTYIFSYLSDKQRAWYEQWMKQSYLEELESLPNAVKQRDYFISRVRAGEFKFGNEEFNRVKDTEVGRVKFFQMLLMDNTKDVTYEEVYDLLNAEPIRTSVIFGLILVESEAIITRASKVKTEQALQETYKKLTLPTDAGGLGIPIEIVAEFTDKQKQALLMKEVKDYAPLTKEELAVGNKAVDDFFAKAKLAGVAVNE